ncbi:uncharacterized protein LOC111318904 isoform X2 [Stylophora pistillata]|uniref:Tumor necrosis factor receptor superfamily member 22 n=1 Tax=Stylophora pistillata TaxID=50429 RepID=A0A2B4R4G6_STYPI|nr:uncharacterized protein LOC111318904 isoform X2 [Stylophora pistillata]PFX12046.1 Tumor necrosis factor receptor superfamily member 22 [Stylophora pistillata]
MGIHLLRHNVFIFLLVRELHSVHVCRHNQHALETPNGSFVCLDCLKCPPGLGITIPCGNKIPYSASVECRTCNPGYYSDSHSSESCKPCVTCGPNEIMVTACTETSDTRCRCKPCPEGYYQNQTLSKCFPCSGCCPGDLDVIVPQCLKQGMPRAQACRYRKKKPCSAKCWYDEITVVKNDGEQICLPCPLCSDEFGLTKPCGSVVTDGAIPKCELPIVGKKFVNQHGILQSCTNCALGQNTVENCSTKSDTICGECKLGFYLNAQSNTCEECFWCCRHSDSKSFIDCIKEARTFAETFSGLGLHLFYSPFVLNRQSGKLHTEQHGGSLVEYVKLDTFTATLIGLGFALVLFHITKRRPMLDSEHQCPFLNKLETKRGLPMGKKDLPESAETTQSTPSGSKRVEWEYPKRHGQGHVVFEKTGVEAVVLDSSKSTLKHVPSDLVLHATSDELGLPGLLEDDEFPLSPAIQLTCISKSKLTGPLELQIPHGANMVLSSNKWKVVLKELKNGKWVVLSYVKGSGIEEFLPKSNHVSFETDHFATFAVVGHCKEQSLPVFKRMKVMAFCSDTRVGEDLVVRLYCFDDCEWSFENLLRREKKEGGKLISSVDSFDFTVTREEDVEIVIKDSDGWKLENGCPTKISYASVKNSFCTTPRCNLVFSSASTKKKSSFFSIIVLTQASSQTFMYARTAIKEDPFCCANQSSFPNAVNEGNQVTNMADITVANGGMGKERDITDCIIQLQT